MIGEFAARLRNSLRALPLIAGLTCFVTTAQAEVTISDQPTRAMKCAEGVCTPKRAKANLNVTDLANMLAAGDVKVVSDGAAMDIVFGAPLSWTSKSRLTLDSYRYILFQQPISVTGKGALTITTNDGGTAGDYTFIGGGQIQFWSAKSSLVINGINYTLVRSIAELKQVAQSNCDCAREEAMMQSRMEHTRRLQCTSHSSVHWRDWAIRFPT